MSVGKRHARKLLVASLGVAAVSYVQCGGDTNSTSTGKDAGSDQTIDVPVGNLVGPDTSNMDVVANLVAPDVQEDNTAPDAADDNTSILDVVANLVAPDAGD